MFFASLTALIRQITAPEPANKLESKPSIASLAEQSFPLLSLPLEIRLQIFRYLCPDVDCDSLFQSHKVLRADGFVCNPAIFLINRQLFDEVRDEWYGQVYYRARIHPTGFHLHGCVWSLYRELPRTLGYIRNLDLEIQLKTPGWMDWDTDRKEPTGLYCCREFLEKCVRDGRMDRLRKLKLRFGVSIAFFEYYSDRMGDLRGDLEKEMKGLGKLKGLRKVQFTGVGQGYGYHGTLPEELLRGSGKDNLQIMTRIMEDFVRELTADIGG